MYERRLCFGSNCCIIGYTHPACHFVRVVVCGDPVEQEEQVKYTSLIAKAIILSNVEDLTGVLFSMAADGVRVPPESAGL